MKRSSKKTGNSLRIAFIFLCIIALLIAGGVFLKLFLILRASTFSPSHQYILEVDESNQKGALIAFLPASRSVVTINISGKVGDSGFGEYHGEEGFKAFSKMKSIFIQNRISLVSWLYPPYGKLARYFLRFFAGIRYDG